MRWIRRAALFASVACLAVTPLAGQRVADHKGVWFGGGLGMGSARLSCSICRAGRDGGAAGYLRVGATVTRQVLVGAETLLWYHSDGPVDYLLGSVQAVVLLYPMKDNGFYLKTGLGLAQYSAKDSDDKASTQALAAQVGVGYEVLVGKGMSIVPFANFMGTTGADLRFNDTVSGLSANTSLFQLGVGLTLH